MTNTQGREEKLPPLMLPLYKMQCPAILMYKDIFPFNANRVGEIDIFNVFRDYITPVKFVIMGKWYCCFILHNKKQKQELIQ